MQALLIAGGFGTRMRPLTYTRPKHLLPIANRPHIEHVFDLLQRHDVNAAVLLTSFLAEAFAQTVTSAADRGMEVQICREETPLGTAGALKNAARIVGKETFLAMNGDVLTDADLSALVEFHRAGGGMATMLLTPVEDPSQFGVVATDDRGCVRTFIEKPPKGEAPTNLINAGVYVLEPEVLEWIPEGEEHSAERQLFPALVEQRELFALSTEAYWLDVGTPSKYLQANLDALDGRLVVEEISLRAEGSVLRGDATLVAEGAEVTRSCLGDAVKVGANAKVTASVLLPGVEIGEHAVVERSILGEGAEVAANISLIGATVGDGERVDKSEVIA
jgi:NDP-sugar pyrophosphorylase family protein